MAGPEQRETHLQFCWVYHPVDCLDNPADIYQSNARMAKQAGEEWEEIEG
jgi:hypothetical protein